VDSEPGSGTRIEVLLPNVDSAECDEPEVSRRVVQRGDGETILLVEDEPAVRAMTRRTLEILDYVVLEAANGREGLRLQWDHTGVSVWCS
jgi:hypothetical protein